MKGEAAAEGEAEGEGEAEAEGEACGSLSSADEIASMRALRAGEMVFALVGEAR